MIDFNQMIDNYLHRKAGQKTVGRYYPSEAGSCIRKVWYSYKQPKELGPEVQRIFKMGNMVHDFVADVLKSEKNPEIELLQSELPLIIDKKDFILSGRVDNILLVKKNNQKVLVEVKSTKMLDMVKEPVDSHLMQLHLYMHATGIHSGMLLYVEKSTLQSREFPVEYDESVVQDVMSRFYDLHKHLTTDKLPAPEAKQKQQISWMCNYCEYRERCDLDCESEKSN
ncbi:MAG: PD-(D/E)XK nuclease family protein [Candidatus Aenigmatarchaeota archaeon]